MTCATDRGNHGRAVRMKGQTERIVRVEGRGPIFAVGTSHGKRATNLEARRGEKDAIPVPFACEQATVLSPKSCPSNGAILYQLIELRLCRHTPTPAKLLVCHVI